MPLVAKGGKYIFGWSRVNDDLSIQLPKPAVDEYAITAEGKVILISGSKRTGGFVVTRKGLLLASKIGNILKENPSLSRYETEEGEFTKYKGRLYCWHGLSGTGMLKMNEKMIEVLDIGAGDMLLSIRSSDIAFCMGQKGILIERARKYQDEIVVY